MLLLTVISHTILTGFESAEATAIEEGCLGMILPGVENHLPPAAVSEVTLGAGILAVTVSHQEVVSQVLLVLGVGPTETALQHCLLGPCEVIRVLRERTTETAGDALNFYILDDLLKLIVILLLLIDVMILYNVFYDLTLYLSSDATIFTAKCWHLVVFNFDFFFLIFGLVKFSSLSSTLIILNVRMVVLPQMHLEVCQGSCGDVAAPTEAPDEFSVL